MANVRRRLAINAPGTLFVDDSCIECDTCRQIAPQVFERSAREERSFVARQPPDEAARLAAGKALVACPTSSNGSEEKLALAAALRAFPEHIADGVHYCGFTAAESFGASSYLIVRPRIARSKRAAPGTTPGASPRRRPFGPSGGLLVITSELNDEHSTLALVFGLAALVLLRGCPLCWAVGLYGTLRARWARRRQQAF
jgi:ferredoxin